MDNSFVNRKSELERLNGVESGLVVVYGRRRVGKSALIDQWLLRKEHSVRSQAIESSPHIQLSQIYEDLREPLGTSLEPQNWEQLFELIDNFRHPLYLCIDEFPYLVRSDSSLPSRFQRWIDLTKKKDLVLILAGSSVKMMHSAALSENSPLFGRAQEILNIRPMRYHEFCEHQGLPPLSRQSFLNYSLTGGVPKYWQLRKKGESPVELATRLYFISGAYMQREPFRVLSDEDIEGLSPLSVLEAVGRGATKPSEIAAKIGVTQGSIYKTLQSLMDASVIVRRKRFGDSERNSKISLYHLIDPTVRFWFSVYSPHRSRWSGYDEKKKERLLAGHAGFVLESVLFSKYPDGRSYWEKDIEIDFVRPTSHQNEVIVSARTFHQPFCCVCESRASCPPMKLPG
jgi:AAA+ ATPase superfamily predicted ATPase